MDFCKKCGSELEDGLDFCGNCGSKTDEATDSVIDPISQYNAEIETKQKAKPARPFTAFIVVIVALTVLNMYQFMDKQAVLEENQNIINELSEEKTAMDKRLSSLQDTNKTNVAEIGDLRRQVSTLSQLSNFINSYVVFRADDGTWLYHKWDCSVWQSWHGTFWAYNTELARSYGVSPHDCAK